VSSERKLRLSELAKTPAVPTSELRSRLHMEKALAIPALKGDAHQSLGQVRRVGDHTT
jgi:hypothetical protein